MDACRSRDPPRPDMVKSYVCRAYDISRNGMLNSAIPYFRIAVFTISLMLVLSLSAVVSKLC